MAAPLAVAPDPAGDEPSLPVGTPVMAALTAIGPVSFQIFLPALPAIQTGFGVTPGTAQLALSLSMFGIAFATLAYGPLSDRFGRRPALIGGMATLIAGCLVCAFAPDITTLIVGRVLQAAGGASGMVVTRAIVVDIHGREKARSVLASLMTVMIAGPLLATPIGGLIVDGLGWRANFIAIAICAAAILAYLWRRLPETHRGQPLHGPVFAGFASLVRAPAFLGFALQSGFAMAAFMAFTTASPYYFAEALGIGATGFGFYVTLVTLGFLGGSLSASRLSSRVRIDRMVLLGSVVALAASAAALGLALGGIWTVWGLIGPAAAIGFANGLSMPSAQAGAVASVPELAGTASGLAGFLGTLIGAVATQIVGAFQDATPLPIAVAMTLASVCALLAAWSALATCPDAVRSAKPVVVAH
jgi:DHA1 family bicyclomycin/chloramphenicol resistance-like MFS transporter